MTRYRTGPWAVWLDSADSQGPVRAAIESFDREGGAQVGTAGSPLWPIHTGGRSTVYGVRLSEGKACLKVFDSRSFTAKLRVFLGWSKGRRAFRNGLQAFGRGVPAPRVYAYAEKRPAGPTLVVMELLEGAVQMNLLLEEWSAGGLDLAGTPGFHSLAERFAGFTRDLHDRGVCHRDFSPRNVLVAAPDGDMRLQLIDLEDLDFAGNNRKFRSNIEHFHGKMARYVDAAALEIFSSAFKRVYGG